MQDIIGAGPRIRKWRKSIPMKSFELAKMIKISQGSLSDIENGKSNPSAPTIVGFMKHTNINIHWMLTGKEGDIKNGEMPKQESILTINVSPGQEILIKGRD